MTNTTIKINDHIQNPDDELSLLDLVVMLAENAYLLIGVSLAGALIGLGGTALLPSIYESTSLLRLSESDGAMMKSVDVLKPVIEELKLQRGELFDTAVMRVGLQIAPTFSKKEGFLKLSTQAQTPEAAQALNIAVQDSFKRFALPKGRALESIEGQLRITRGTVDELGAGALRVSKSLDKVNPGTEAEAMTRSYVTMIEQRDTRQKQLLDLQASLKGIGTEIIIQQATLPTEPIKSKRFLVAILAAVAAGFVCLLFILIRNSLKSAKGNTTGFEKIQRIRYALGLSAG